VHITVRLFARLRELAGTGELRREVPDGSTALDVWNGLSRDYPAMADYTKAISVAVNEEYARLTASVRDGDEVAFLPPVSGGSGASERSERVAGAARDPRATAQGVRGAKPLGVKDD